MQELRAEMVASVWKHVVQEGDRVQDGDVLVVLESMKMEIPVHTERAGIVRSVKVTPGDVVQEGDVLIEVVTG